MAISASNSIDAVLRHAAEVLGPGEAARLLRAAIFADQVGEGPDVAADISRALLARLAADGRAARDWTDA